MTHYPDVWRTHKCLIRPKLLLRALVGVGLRCSILQQVQPPRQSRHSMPVYRRLAKKSNSENLRTLSRQRPQNEESAVLTSEGGSEVWTRLSGMVSKRGEKRVRITLCIK